MIRRPLLLLPALLSLAAFQWDAKVTPRYRAAMDQVSERSIRANLKFIASDLLEGRDTPSRGLDIAAEFIASHFERAGLEPAVNGSYFQETTFPKNDQGKPVRNVIGLLRGSDPKLANTYVMVSAHYDHVGVDPKLTGDQIFNGANDDGSGTVTVIELAYAFASMKERPKRSILFMTFYGEEKGLQGSRYYGANPVFPLKDTIAQINLEQVGRTDDVEGSMVGKAGITGFDYSDVGVAIQTAGKAAGIEFVKHPRNSDAFFSRSDNQALANVGVPAHTISTGYVFPEYHAPGDHADKIDYDHMTKLTRALVVAVGTLADSSVTPKWNEAHPRTKRYVEAWKKLQG